MTKCSKIEKRGQGKKGKELTREKRERERERERGGDVDDII